MNHVMRTMAWANRPGNYVQKERDGSTGYYFGDSYINARTLSGTHAHLETKPKRRVRQVKADGLAFSHYRTVGA